MDCMLYLLKHFKYLMPLIFIFGTLSSQVVVKEWKADSSCSHMLADTNFPNMDLNNSYKKQILLALINYQKLRQTRIVFKVSKHASPLSARPTFLSIFRRPDKRSFIVFISNKTVERLEPILLQNLGFNAQIGVLSHELAHILEFRDKKFRYFVALALKHLSKRAMDEFEFNTDKSSIEHGYGYQLLSWSIEVRKKLNLSVWGGVNNEKPKRERYMNPLTIQGYISNLSIYKTNVK